MSTPPCYERFLSVYQTQCEQDATERRNLGPYVRARRMSRLRKEGLERLLTLALSAEIDHLCMLLSRDD